MGSKNNIILGNGLVKLVEPPDYSTSTDLGYFTGGLKLIWQKRFIYPNQMNTTVNTHVYISEETVEIEANLYEIVQSTLSRIWGAMSFSSNAASFGGDIRIRPIRLQFIGTTPFSTNGTRTFEFFRCIPIELGYEVAPSELGVLSFKAKVLEHLPNLYGERYFKILDAPGAGVPV